jgi:hypothetical protein
MMVSRGVVLADDAGHIVLESDGDTGGRNNAEDDRDICADELAVVLGGLERIRTKGQNGIRLGGAVFVVEVADEPVFVFLAWKLGAIQEFGMGLHRQTTAKLRKPAAHGFAGKHGGIALTAVRVNDQQPFS